MNFRGGCPGYHGHAWPITCPRSWGKLTERRGPDPPTHRYSPCPLPFGPSIHHLVHPPSLAVGLPPPVLAPSLSSLCPPSSLLPPLLAATLLASLPPCCGSWSWSRGPFATLSISCPGEPALSFAVVGHTAQAHCSPPPSSLSPSSQLLIRVAPTVRPPSIAGAAPLHRPQVHARRPNFVLA